MKKIMDLKVAWAEYSVSEESTLIDGDDRCFGSHSYVHKTIKLETGHPGVQRAATFIHEILHALAYIHGYEMEESLVRGLSHSLAHLLEENPAARQYLMKLLSPKVTSVLRK